MEEETIFIKLRMAHADYIERLRLQPK